MLKGDSNHTAALVAIIIFVRWVGLGCLGNKIWVSCNHLIIGISGVCDFMGVYFWSGIG